MTITTLSSRAFQQNANQAQKATRNGPVFITNRGKPTQVLLSFDDYRRLTGSRAGIADLLAMPGIEDVELEVPTSRETARAADLS